MSELLLIAVAVGITALVIWLRQRRKSVGLDDDALTRACSGDREQAQRLEDLEHTQAQGTLSRKDARQRALDRLIDDRST